MKNRNPLNLTKTERIFVFVTVILGVLVDNVSSKLLHYIMPIAQETAVIGGILRIIGNILMALAIAFIVAKMIQVFRRSGFTQKRILALVACAACILLVIVFNIWRYKAVQNFSQYFESTNAEINRSTLNKLSQNLPLDKKSKLSFLHAKSVFTDEGRIIEYLSPEGKSVPFTPSPEDQSNRNVFLFLHTQSGFEKVIVTVNSLSWLIALFGAFIFGFTAKNSEQNISTY